jgi:DNA-binding MarR family transcriptional regulator
VKRHSRSAQDLHQLSEDMATTATRLVRWLPTEGFNLSLAAVRILGRLSDRGPTRISDIAVLEHSTQPTITNHVKRLEAAGLVHRDPDPADARAWLIDLTPEGREQLAHLRRLLGTNVEPHLDRLSNRDLQALESGLIVLKRIIGTKD